MCVFYFEDSDIPHLQALKIKRVLHKFFELDYRDCCSVVMFLLLLFLLLSVLYLPCFLFLFCSLSCILFYTLCVLLLYMCMLCHCSFYSFRKIIVLLFSSYKSFWLNNQITRALTRAFLFTAELFAPYPELKTTPLSSKISPNPPPLTIWLCTSESRSERPGAVKAWWARNRNDKNGCKKGPNEIKKREYHKERDWIIDFCRFRASELSVSSFLFFRFHLITFNSSTT